LGFKGAAYTVYGLNRNNGDLWWLFYALPVSGIATNAFLYWRGITVAVPDPVIHAAFARIGGAIRKIRIRHARARAA
jgi:hypothetical protein